MLTITCRCEHKHWVEFSQAACWRASGIFALFLPISMGLVAGGITWLGAYCEACDIDQQSFNYGVWSAMAGLFVWGFLYTFIQTPRWNKPDGFVLGNKTFVLTEEKLECIGHRHKTEYLWSAFEAVTTKKHIVILWVEPSAGEFIPRASFKSDQDESAFLDFVNRRMQAVRMIE
ncbi:MAG: YcxB family protein [Hyphomicrobiaceae bacterium]